MYSHTLERREESTDFAISLFVVLVLFIVNPFFGMIFSIFIALISPNDYRSNKKELMLFMISVATWISLVNITKSIGGDQGVYTRMFLKVPTVSLTQYFNGEYGTGSGREPMFRALTYILYWITGGSVRAYYFIISFVIYFLQFSATYLLFKKLKTEKGAIICGVLILTFFTQYFVMTLQIMRQMIAGAMAVYALVYRAVYGKHNWFFLIMAPLIHTSAFLITIITLVPVFYSWLNLKKAILVLVCFAPVIILNELVGNLVGGYGGNMLANTGYRDSGGTMSITIMLILFIPLTLAAIVNLKRYKTQYNGYYEGYSSKPSNVILPIIYCFFLLSIFVLSFSKSPLLQYRFFYYSYSFMPLLMPLLIIKRPWNNVYWSLISVYFIIRFFIIHNRGWIYATQIDLLSKNNFFYFTGDFHWMYNLTVLP